MRHGNRMMTWVVGVFALALSASSSALLPAASFEVTDTLAPPQEEGAAARQALEALVWEPGTFDVAFHAEQQGHVVGTLSFPSPRPAGAPNQDRVQLDWYAARDAQGRVVRAPAVVVVHSLHPQLVLAKMAARSLAAQGVHAFVVELPGYARRIDGAPRYTGVTALEHSAQGVADIRRARDVVAALPAVEPGRVSLQGTSLGGFFATGAAALDGGFEHVFLFLSGGNCYDVLTGGDKDAKRLRQSMAGEGYDDARLRNLLDPVEPLVLAHRLDPHRTYLFTARGDQVVTPGNSAMLAKAIGLDEQHHVQFDGNHYTSLLLLPGVVERIVLTLRPPAVAPVAEATQAAAEHAAAAHAQ